MSDAPRYCPFYCEENIWHLCADPRIEPSIATADRRVLYISNSARRVAMWGQRAATDPSLPLAWDYHVVMLFHPPDLPWQVWDLDASDPGPRAGWRWLSDSFDAVGLLPPVYAPRFRMITAADYLRHFRSDRRHMRAPDGTIKQPPPPWPAILGEPVPGATDDGSNLERFIDCEDPDFLSELLDLEQLRRLLA